MLLNSQVWLVDEVVCDSYPTIRRLFVWFEENCTLHKLCSSVTTSIHSASRPPWHNHRLRQYLAGYQIPRQPLDLHNEVITLFFRLGTVMFIAIKIRSNRASHFCHRGSALPSA